MPRMWLLKRLGVTIASASISVHHCQVPDSQIPDSLLHDVPSFSFELMLTQFTTSLLSIQRAYLENRKENTPSCCRRTCHDSQQVCDMFIQVQNLPSLHVHSLQGKTHQSFFGNSISTQIRNRTFRNWKILRRLSLEAI